MRKARERVSGKASLGSCARLLPCGLRMGPVVRTLGLSDVDVGFRAAFAEWTRKEGCLMATLVELRREIDARMHRGASFSSIEDDVIDTSNLPEEQKSALWLYGWSFVALDAQRREAQAHITQLATTDAPREAPRAGLRLVPSPASN